MVEGLRGIQSGFNIISISWYWRFGAILVVAVAGNTLNVWGLDQGLGTYEAVVLGEEDGDARVYFANCQGDQHRKGGL